MARSENRALGLWAIVAFKVLKGGLLLALAFGVFSLVGKDLEWHFERMLRAVRIDPERQFFDDLASRLSALTPATVGWIALGTLIYSLFSLVEAVGLALRVRWVGWVALGESAFFVPIEAHHLVRHFSLLVFGVLIVNVWIVVYLYRNRERLFHHRPRPSARSR